MTEASNEALDGVDMEIAAATEVDSDGMAAGEFSPAVEGVIVEENEDDPDSSTTAYSMTNLEGIEADVDEDPESLEPKLPSDAVSDASKPLKSILKKRKSESIPGEQNVEEDNEPADKIPKGGSITQALKLLTGYTNKSDDEGDDTEPKPSAFVLEMERQKAMSATAAGATNLPAGYGNTESSTKDHYFNPFDIHNNKISDRKEQQETAVAETDGVAKLTDSKQEDGKRKNAENYDIDSALPTGYAYVTVERYYDMTDLLKLSGFEYQGRRLRVTKSTRENLLEDWQITKIALSELDKSRVICIKHVPFVLTKSELIKALHEVKFNEEDIYWSPLRKNQTNSGRAFVVLWSSEDAKKLHNRSFPTMGRHIGVTQVHPDDMMKFLEQCRMRLRPGTRVLDDLPANAGDISDLSLETGKSPSPTNVAVEHKKSKKAERRLRRLESEQENWEKSHANFVPTVYVRLFNAPERTTANDIQSFFEPLKAAHISQVIGFNIWDVEFFSPSDGMQAMSKHALLMRKNVIRLEMLRGPPQPPQMHQSQFIMPHPGMIQPGMGPPPRGMMPPLRMDAGPPGMMQHTAHPGFPGFVGSRMPPPVPRLPPMFPPRMWHPTPPVGHPMNAGHLAMRHPEPARWNSSEPLINPRGHHESRYEIRRAPKSPEHPPPPKKEIIPVPPIPDDFTKYVIPPFDGETPVGQAIIKPMQGYFCQLCNKFYSTKTGAKEGHCKTKGHYDKLKQVLEEKKRLRKLAEAEHTAKR